LVAAVRVLMVAQMEATRFSTQSHQRVVENQPQQAVQVVVDTTRTVLAVQEQQIKVMQVERAQENRPNLLLVAVAVGLVVLVATHQLAVRLGHRV